MAWYTYSYFSARDYEWFDVDISKEDFVDMLKEHLIKDPKAYEDEVWEEYGTKEYCLEHMEEIVETFDSEVINDYIEQLGMNEPDWNEINNEMERQYHEKH